MNTKREINQYLACEFGRDLSVASDVVPFELVEVGVVDGVAVFTFVDNGESYYVLGGPSLDYYPCAEMTLDDLALQKQGARLIAAAGPIDLRTSMIGYDEIPPAAERHAQVQGLCFDAGLVANVLEGLYLQNERNYAVLVEVDAETAALLWEGTTTTVGFPRASNWRRMAWAMAKRQRC